VINAFPWWACLPPLLRPLATVALMLLVGLLQRWMTGRWPTVEDWRAPSAALPTPSRVIGRAVDLLRTHGTRRRAPATTRAAMCRSPCRSGQAPAPPASARVCSCWPNLRPRCAGRTQAITVAVQSSGAPGPDSGAADRDVAEVSHVELVPADPFADLVQVQRVARNDRIVQSCQSTMPALSVTGRAWRSTIHVANRFQRSRVNGEECHFAASPWPATSRHERADPDLASVGGDGREHSIA